MESGDCRVPLYLIKYSIFCKLPASCGSLFYKENTVQAQSIALSYSQQALWFIYRDAPKSTAYNMALPLRFVGDIDRQTVQQAVRQLVERHSMLRCRFHELDGVPFQYVATDINHYWQEVDAGGWTEQALTAELHRHSQQPFTLEQGVFRATLFQGAKTGTVLLLNLHHIAGDAASLAILGKELPAFYTAEELPPPAMAYGDYVRWEAELLGSKKGQRMATYWQQRLAGEVPVLQLPTDYPRPPRQTFNGASVRVDVPEQLTAAVKNLAKVHKSTLFTVLFSAYQVLLQRYSGQDDIWIGVPTSTPRNQTGFADMVGYLVNPMIMRGEFSNDKNVSFSQLVQLNGRQLLTGLYHQPYPFTLLIEQLQPQRNPAYPPLVQALFALERDDLIPKQFSANGLLARSLDIAQMEGQLDLALTFSDSDDGKTLSAVWDYNRDLFKEATVARMAEHLHLLLQGAVDDAGQDIAKMPLLTEAEKAQLKQWKPTETDYPKDQTVVGLFERQVETTPDNLAVIFEGRSLNYRQLNEKANQLAHYLLSLKTRSGTALLANNPLIAIAVERSLEMIIGLLAVFKTGGAYVPIDPDYPSARILDMLDGSATPLLLTTSNSQSRLPLAGTTHDYVVLCLDELDVAGQPTDNPAGRCGPEDLAYVIYTSGSTGNPKGVMVGHQALTLHSEAMLQQYGLAENDRALQFASLSFDTSLEQLLVAWLSGACSVLLASNLIPAADLLALIKKHAITVADLPPAYWQQMLEIATIADDLLSLRMLILGGEALPLSLAQQTRKRFPALACFNAYGPTEAVITPCVYRLPMILTDNSHYVAIGKPRANTPIYILNGQLQAQPVGIPGELCIAGSGLAQGYLGRPELTAEKFIEVDLFGQQTRIYKTGDLARWLPDGNLEYLGRIDRQIKLRGFRIELGEIEALLCQHPEVKEAVVNLYEADGDKRIAAYLTTDNGSFGTEDLRTWSKARLPDYMVPSHFMVLDGLPLTPNGKIDRKALPAPEFQASTGFSQPATPAEDLLAALWAGVLKREVIGRQDNFFELGGHSLLATQLVARIRESFQVELPIRAVFEHPQLSGLAAAIEAISGGIRLPAIEPQAADAAKVLSFAQQRLWFLDQFEGNNSATYNIPDALRLSGQLDVSALQQSLHWLMERHAGLRSYFPTISGQAQLQIRAIDAAEVLQIHDLRSLPVDVREHEAQRLTNSHAIKPFDLGQGPLFKADLLRLDETDAVLLLNMHHIISDGWSMDVFMRDWQHAYAAFAGGNMPGLPELAVQYSDYAAWQRQWFQGEVLQRQVDYWTGQLKGLPELLELPTDKPRPPQQSYRGAHFTRSLPATLSQAVGQLSVQQGATLFMTLLAAFEILLSRYSRQQDICVGSPIANRTHAHTEDLIGFFANTLVLRSRLDPQQSFAGLLQATRQTCLEAYAHQDIPFEMLVEKLQPTRSLSHSPLFQVMFVLQNTEMNGLALPGLDIAALGMEYPVAKFDLTLHVAEQDGHLHCYWEYATDLFAGDTIQRMAGHFEALLNAIVDNPQQAIGRLPLLTAQETLQLQSWNDTATDYPKDRTIVDLFEQQVETTPDNLAVIFAGQSLNYRQLNEKANRLAHYLLGLKSEAGTALLADNPLIAIIVERSLEMIVGLLAILKAGGAYVPIDPNYPAIRIRHMLEDSQAPLLLTQSRLQAQLSQDGVGHGCVPLCLDELDVSGQPAENLAGRSGPEDLAYVIYTSGSTGMPKGVCIANSAVVRLVKDTNYIQINADDCIAQASNVSFDAATFEIWGSLLNGARLAGIAKELLLSPHQLTEHLQSHRINTLFVTTALFNQIAQTRPDCFKTLKCLLIGGEQADPHWVNTILSKHPPERLLNAYGPTETTTFASWYLANSGQQPDNINTIPIGRPLANTEIFILNPQHQPQPPNIPGELCIAGVGLARGYLNRPELTAEKFIEVELFGKLTRIYKTGDLARWLPDGNIEFLGRIDQQIKLRGFRIELGEIEAMLCQYPEVKEAVANLYEADGDKRIVAYLTTDNGSFSTEDLRGWLKARLPDYMVPSHFLCLDSLPLTPNGKIDRKALPAPEAQQTEGFSPPATPAEELLAALWAGVLKREAIGRQDNFFELGGHSLLATQLVARIRESFQVELPIRALFEHPQLSDLASAIEAAAGVIRLPAIEPQAADAAKVLSFAQQRLWFLNQFEGNNSATYNIPFALRLSGQLDVSALQQSLHWLMERHASLRCHFSNVSGQAQLQIQAIEAVEVLKIHDLRHLATDGREREAQCRADSHAIAPFDLEQGPLFRADLLRLDGTEAVLLLNMHHIVSDGWSMGVFMRDWQHAYAAFAGGDTPGLPELAIQYSDYAAWQRQWFQGEVLQRQIDYWTGQLNGLPELLELPTDKPRPPQQSYRGAHVAHSLPATLGQAVARLSRQQGVTVFMTLLAAFNVLLSRYNRQQDICVGSPIANRTHSHSEDLIGFFVNPLVLRSQVEPQQSFIDLLQATRQTCLDAYAHQDIPFEMLVEKLQPTRSLSHSPLFQVMFVLQNNEAAELALPDVAVSFFEAEYPVAKFDLTLNVDEQGGQLHCSWEYATDLFEGGTIERMAGHFEALLNAIVTNPRQAIGRLPVLTEQDIRQLQAWNDTAADYPKDQTIVGLFERQVETTPDNIAVVFEGQSLSYRQLNDKANQLAHHLLGLKTETGAPLLADNPLIAIAVERSPDMIVGLLAILKAGGAYLPVDPGYPAVRIRHMLEDSQAPLLLSQSRLLAQLPLDGHGCEVLCLDELDASGQPTENPARKSGPEDLAYVIYTSGSTGLPKGVMIEHENLVNLCTWHIGAFAVQPSDKATLLANSAFDASVWELWPYLAAGACVMPANLEALLAKGIWHTLDENNITVSFLPTPIINNASDYPASNVTNLRLLLTGGDALHQCPNSLPCPLINNYGPTETTVVATSTAVMADGPISIGKAIANTRIYILDAQHQPQAPGIPGELCIAGAGLARGYLNRPELTAEKFIEAELFGISERIYKTGDLARRLPDGNLEFLGRIDRQIKLRGFRIELGEIETLLCQYPGVKEAVVNLYEGDGNQRIVAYLTQDRESTKDGLITELRSWLKTRLPEHMVPASFTLLDVLPLTPNGKIDRKSLPAPDVMLSAKGYEPPGNHAEQKIAAAWRNVLKREQIGIHDSFFELGGHSLLVIQVLGLLQQDYPQLKVVDLFSYPTVSALAGYLEQIAVAPQQKSDSSLRGEKRRARLATRQQK
jgi:amino acid adenylation domain-containing protein